MKTLALLLLTFFITTTAVAQHILNIPVACSEEQPAISFFAALEKTNRVKFCFREDWIRFAT
ncbi:MAG TPA: hypothetical protein VGD31_16710, partial [Sphingobacteriaceae bacterium]